MRPIARVRVCGVLRCARVACAATSLFSAVRGVRALHARNAHRDFPTASAHSGGRSRGSHRCRGLAAQPTMGVRDSSSLPVFPYFDLNKWRGQTNLSFHIQSSRALAIRGLVLSSGSLQVFSADPSTRVGKVIEMVLGPCVRVPSLR